MLAVWGKVSKCVKIRNRYNQVPHLTQDTNWKVTNLQLDTTNESQEVSPFPASDHKQAQGPAFKSNILKPSCSTSHQYLPYLQISEQSVQWLVSNILEKIGWFWAHPWASCRVRHFETLLHNFTYISTKSSNFRTIHPMVNENSCGQTLAERKRSRRRRNGTKQ